MSTLERWLAEHGVYVPGEPGPSPVDITLTDGPWAGRTVQRPALTGFLPVEAPYEHDWLTSYPTPEPCRLVGVYVFVGGRRYVWRAWGAAW